MANPWFRLWADMVNDPKWRTIARVSKQKIGDVIAVYVHMMTCASNATERGRTEGWNDEDVATALDIGIEQVTAIREAMQGRVLEGDYLSGWEKRQPLKEDGSAERSKAWREAQKAANEHGQTPPNETERQQTQDTDKEEKKSRSKTNPSAAPKYSPIDELLNQGVDKQTAKDWIALRAKKRSDVSKTAIDGFKAEAVKADISLVDALKMCCQRGWQGFNAEWVKGAVQARASPDHPTLGKAGQVTAANAQKFLEASDAEQ